MECPVIGDQLLLLIPQRPPMVMVSSLENYQEHGLVASLLIEKDTLFVTSDGLVESGLLEHMAQAVALHTGYTFFLRDQMPPTGYIGSMQSVQITALPMINQRIFSEISILQEFMGVTLVEIITKLEGEIIAQAQMKTVIATQ